MKLTKLTAPLCALSTLAFLGNLEAETVIRLMAANITSGNNQSYDAGHGTRIFQGLDPDIVMIQEFNYGNNSASAIRGWIDTTFGPEFQYYREGGAQIPNGIISRYPIKASGEWDDTSVSNRDFAWARIDIPGDKDLWAISVHLLTTSATVRNTEAVQLKNFINANVPTGDYLVIGGDFNTGSRTEPALSTLSSVVVTSGPYPVDKNGKDGTNASRSKPYDWVLVDNDLHQYRTPVLIGNSTFPNGLVVDSRVYSPLSEIYPVQSGDSGAANMQHMAVVRDFLIPDGGSTGGGNTGGGISSGETVTGSVSPGQWMYYTVNVESNVTSMTIKLEGTNSGDADLYIRKGSPPTSSSYDFRPYLNGSNETVTVSAATNPAVSAGTWHIGVYGYSAAGYKLTVTKTTGSTGGGTTTPLTLLNTSSSVAQGAWMHFPVNVPSGKTKMTVTLSGSGDADLYVKQGSQPTASSYHFRPYLDGSAESVTVNQSTNPKLTAGTWYVSVNGYTASSFTIVVVVE